MNVKSYFWTQTIAKKKSKYNGTVSVEVSFDKYYLSSGGLMQSGPFLERVWKNGIKKLGISNLTPRKVLILGLGGGSFARVASKVFKDPYILGVDIDPVIIEFGKRYLALNEINNLDIHIADAQNYVVKELAAKHRYDLIFLDLFNGYETPLFSSDIRFLKKIVGLKSKTGMLIINRLFFGKYKAQTNTFIRFLVDNFSTVNVVTSYSNALISVA